MPRKRSLPRLRRLRWIAAAAMLAVTLGAVVAAAAGADAARQEPGGRTGVVVGLILALASGVLLIRVLGTYGRVAQADWRELRARGRDDGLPVGVFREGQRVGLEASDRLLVLAELSAAAGGAIVVATITDSRVSWQFGFSFSLVWFVPALFLVRLGTGVAYWLAPDGVSKRGRRRLGVRWDDVERVIPMYRGTPVKSIASADAFELHVRTPEPWRPADWLGPDFTLNLRKVEVSRHELWALLEERLRAH